MARDPRETVRSLLRMTVRNGCSEAEARTARERAEAIARANGLRLEDLEDRPQPQRRTGPVFGAGIDEDMLARAMAQMREAFRHAAHKAAREQAHQDQMRRDREARSFKTVGEACVFYSRPGWINSKTKKPLTNEEVAILVRRHFPDARTTAKTVASYKSRAKRDGLL